MPGQPTPTLRRRELGFRLRELRQRAGLTAEQVAGELMCSVAKISRLETGARGVNPRDVRDLAKLYGVDQAERDRLMSLVHDSKQPGWWEDHALPSGLVNYVGLESSASAIDVYESSIVPGLLQTQDYARTLLRELFPHEGSDVLEQYVQTRMHRQRLLGGEGPQLRVLMDEAALRRLVGGPAMMRAQLTELSERVREHQIELGVVPFEAGAHQGMDSKFVILRFAEGLPGVVYVEGLAGQSYFDRAVEIARYDEAFASIGDKAYKTDRSIELIEAIARSLG